jgi:chaperonin GroES
MLPRNLFSEIERLAKPFRDKLLTDADRKNLTDQVNKVVKTVEPTGLAERATEFMARFAREAEHTADDLMKNLFPTEEPTVIEARHPMAELKITPLDDRVVLEPLEAEEKTAGGILLPDTAKNKPQQGKVLAVGPGKLNKNGSRREPQVKAGDTVLFTSWAGDEYRDRKNDREILVMHEEDILAVLG